MALKPTALVLAIVLVIAFAVSSLQRPALGQTSHSGRPPVQIVVYPDGSTGFFDPALRQLSIYGADLKLLKSAKYEHPGKPLAILEAPQQ